MSKEWENKPQIGKKAFTKDKSDEGLLSKIFKEHLKLNNKNTNNETKKNETKTLTDHLAKQDIQMANKHIGPHHMTSGNAK